MTFLKTPTAIVFAISLALAGSGKVNAQVDDTKRLPVETMKVKKNSPLQARPAELSARPDELALISRQTTGWSVVGNANFKPSRVDRITFIMASDKTGYVGTSDYFDRTVGTGFRNEMQISKFDGSSWSEIGDLLDDAHLTSMAVDGQGVLHVALQHDVWPPFYQLIEVFKLNGATWERLGTTPIKGGTRSGLGLSLSIDQSTNEIYLAHGNGHHEVMPRENKMTVLKYDPRGQWLPLGGTTMTPGGARSINVVARGGRVFATYADQANNGDFTVREWKNQQWSPLSATAGQPKTGQGSIRLDSRNNPVIVFSKPNDNSRQSLYRWSNTGWAEVLKTPLGLGQLQLDGQDRPIATSRVNRFNVAPAFQVHRYVNGTWRELGEQLDGVGNVVALKNGIYVSQVFPKDGPDWDTFSWEQLEDEQALSEAETWDTRKHITVRKYGGENISIVKPRAVKR